MFVYKLESGIILTGNTCRALHGMSSLRTFKIIPETADDGTVLSQGQLNTGRNTDGPGFTLFDLLGDELMSIVCDNVPFDC